MSKYELALKLFEAHNSTALALRLVGEIYDALPRHTCLTNAWYQLREAQANLKKFSESETLERMDVRPRQI